MNVPIAWVILISALRINVGHLVIMIHSTSGVQIVYKNKDAKKKKENVQDLQPEI